jgi:uncharacterized protein YyaL (SSP411 family)
MNEVFVSIKVDREERPDIDSIYMTICQMMTGGGGWPLTIIMTPDKKPFFAGTYFPKESGFGRIGMMDLIPRLKEVWAAQRETVLSSADKITAALQQMAPPEPVQDLSEPTLRLAYEQLLEQFDKEHGGFGGAPKFPTPHNLLFLLRYWKRAGEEKALQMVEKTLRSMRRGGIYDQVGLGFHRYSTDARWLVPHFEKMLYDQAQLAMAYTEAYLATGEVEHRETAEEIFAYVLRDMTSPVGGFYSGEDADSEGEEGKFYLWTEEEICHALSAAEVDLVTKVFNIKREGNYHDEATKRMTGKNILHLSRGLDEVASQLGMPVRDLQRALEEVRRKLFTLRQRRVYPHKDDKILTDWNGLMIATLAKGAQAFDEPRYGEAARNAAGFILNQMRTKNGRLLHRYREKEAAIPAYLDDYAFFVWGLIELYEATFETQYLQNALDLNEDMIEHFWDDESGACYFTADDSEELLVRKKEVYDGAIPSGNSVAMHNLLRLGRLTANSDLEEKAMKIGHIFSSTVKQVPMGYTQLLVALDFGIGPSYELVVVGDSTGDDTKAMLRAIRREFLPNKVLVLRPLEEESPEILHLADYTRYQTSIDGKATAYICLNYSCKAPTTDIGEMRRMLDLKSPWTGR